MSKPSSGVKPIKLQFLFHMEMILSNNFVNINLKLGAWNIDTLFVVRPYVLPNAVHIIFCEKYIKEDYSKIEPGSSFLKWITNFQSVFSVPKSSFLFLTRSFKSWRRGPSQLSSPGPPLWPEFTAEGKPESGESAWAEESGPVLGAVRELCAASPASPDHLCVTDTTDIFMQDFTG